ncbi:MAG: hypothetical protein ABSC55_02065 [Syntrophorhabdales bacterium]|jgi:hypothetical protein
MNSKHFVLLAQMGTDAREPALRVMERGWRANSRFCLPTSVHYPPLLDLDCTATGHV